MPLSLQQLIKTSPDLTLNPSSIGEGLLREGDCGCLMILQMYKYFLNNVSE